MLLLQKKKNLASKVLQPLLLAEKTEWMTTPISRARGLLKYNYAPQNYAGIFKLPLRGLFPLIHTFGMKFEVDIVFADTNKKVLRIFRSVKKSRFVLPLRYILGGAAFLLEFSNCDIEALEVGDQLRFSEDSDGAAKTGGAKP